MPSAWYDAKLILKVIKGYLHISPNFFFFFFCYKIGGPGSGKVTHSQRLSQESQGQIFHINVIELLKSTFGLTSKMELIIHYDTA